MDFWSSWREALNLVHNFPFEWRKEETTEALLTGKMDHALCLPEILYSPESFSELQEPFFTFSYTGSWEN